MAISNVALVNFAGGELSPKMRGRYDLPIFKTGVERSVNFICETQGPSRFRSGTQYVHHTRGNQIAILVPFQFNDVQSYLLEFTDQKIRIHKDGGVVLEAAKTITGASKASPGVITSVSHGYSTGDEIYIADVGGMTELNGKFYIVTKINDDTFSLTGTGVGAVAINTTGFTTYTSGGSAYRIHEVTSPYTAAQIKEIKYAQNADVMYIAHKSHAPRKFSRISASSFTLATYSRTADPFGSSGNYPGAVAFYEGRLCFGGTTNAPETIWLSMAVDTSGNPRYDNFTTGSSADNACVYTFAPEASGKVDAIRFLAATNKFLVAGTFGGVKKITGSTDQMAITPTSIMVKAVDSFGVENRTPVVAGGITMYIQRGGLIMRTFEYDWEIESYVSIDRNLVADHITDSGIDQVAFQYGDPDILWGVRNDGVLIGLTYKSREDVSGWHRHVIGGDGVVLSVGIMPQAIGNDQVWMVVERVIDGETRRYVEFMTAHHYYPEEEDFFTGDESNDFQKFMNAMYESQKRYIHLDSAISLYGQDRTTGITCTPAAVSGETVVFTAGSAIFSAADVGNQIWKMYADDGTGGGRAEIVTYTDSTHVTCKILKEFDSTDAMAGGEWLITSSSISGLDHLDGAEVSIVADGAVHPSRTVTNGAITLAQESGTVHIGFGYTGFFKSMNIEADTGSGNTQSKKRRIVEAHIRFLNTLGAKFGTDLYDMEQVNFRGALDFMNRPPALFSGNKIVRYADDYGSNDKFSKHVFVMQSQPLPCTIQMLDLYVDTTEE